MTAALEGWITVPEAARQLGVSPQAIHWLATHKRLGEYRLFGRARIVRAEEVTRLAAARDEERKTAADWLTATDAAAMLGLSRYAIYRKATYVPAGESEPAIRSRRSVLQHALLVFRPDIERLAAEHDNGDEDEARESTG